MIYGLISQDKTWYYEIFCWYSSQRGVLFFLSLFYVMHFSSNRWSWYDIVIHCQICASIQFTCLWLVYAVEFWYYGICWYSSQGWSFDIFFLFLISSVFLLIGEVSIMQLFTVWFVLQSNAHVLAYLFSGPNVCVFVFNEFPLASCSSLINKIYLLPLFSSHISIQM